ncbi:MAG: aspartate kinase [Patescibacteria group bacterium]|nr:aspartate kinase [Patescibacteria group bacterium]
MRYHVLHMGVGNVGRAVLRQIIDSAPRLKHDMDIELVYSGLFTGSAGVFEPRGLTAAQIKAFPSADSAELAQCIERVPQPFILIDTTSSDRTLPVIFQALGRGGAVVTANKRPLSGSSDNFNALHAAGGKRLFYETTVGAGLPVIQTLKALLATGDEVAGIQGCFSGTLGFIFSQLESGSLFSQAVLEAKKRGFTEPDPRDDLSGIDVARKALILARILGQSIELSDIKIEKLYPETMQTLSKEEFIKNLPELDESYRRKTEAARQNGQVLRYVATVGPASCRVGLEAVGQATAVGSLKGADNIVVMTTERYHETPLVVQGAGAGAEVTAAGVFGDILEATKAL